MVDLAQASNRSPARKIATRLISGLTFMVLGGMFAWLVIGPFGGSFTSPLFRLPVFSGFALIGAVLYKLALPEKSRAEAILAGFVIYAFTYRLSAFIPDISTYPFSLGWSEASRYYYASLFFSEKLYGSPAALSVLHPSRYLMQSIPFLVEGLPLWFHRLWQVLLWLVFNLGVVMLLAKRLNLPSLFTWILFIMGGFLFLFHGPVYYHLLVMPLLVLVGWNRQRPWRTAAFVLMASAWGGISRINWVPVPGMLAAVLYFLEVPQGRQATWKYLLKPVLWFISGSAVGLLAQKAYEMFSGNPAYYFGSSFTSDLLWYRLLPSRTYLLGILPAALLAAAPAVVAVLLAFVPRWRAYSPWRVLGITGALAVLFAGGVVVSVKIGGGSNLHNLDAFLLVLLVAGAYICFGSFPTDNLKTTMHNHSWSRAVAGLALAAPIFFAVTNGGPYVARDQAGAQLALQALQFEIDRAGAGGEILFISERHLLAFGVLDGVRLVEDYEKVFLMEMAMANNPAYLEAFETDLRSHRFSLIVSEPLVVQYQGRYRQFGEENDAWVRSVSEPVYCYYEPVLLMPEFNLQLFSPGEERCP
jgi:hypothetical protein